MERRREGERGEEEEERREERRRGERGEEEGQRESTEDIDQICTFTTFKSQEIYYKYNYSSTEMGLQQTPNCLSVS